MNNMHVPLLTPTLNDFEQDVELFFEDGSHAKFKYAFHNYEDEFIVVYTEHLGYHSFLEKSVTSVSVSNE